MSSKPAGDALSHGWIGNGAELTTATKPASRIAMIPRRLAVGRLAASIG
jgi:hypothetical protein